MYDVAHFSVFPDGTVRQKISLGVSARHHAAVTLCVHNKKGGENEKGEEFLFCFFFDGLVYLPVSLCVDVFSVS
jgi:hypothetical protein